MQAFEAIELRELVTVTGGGEGQDTGTFGPGAGPNRVHANGDLKVKTPLGLELSGNGTYDSARSDFGACLDKLPANPTDKQLELCAGLPRQ
jgi:hypothetical protein